MEKQKLSKQQRRDLNRLKRSMLSDVNDVSHTKPPAKKAKTAGSSVYKRAVILPPSEYFNQKAPSDRFVVPSDKAYRDILQKCYCGFEVDDSSVYSDEFHRTFRSALLKMDSDKFFQYDFTQPAGLNTTTKKTLVTRCLVGDPGLTYKYLGLRMFSHPWNSEGAAACKDIKALSDQIADRTTVLLRESGRSESSCRYNLTLINKCSAGSHKEEPMFKKDKLSVSWHSDSSLEHFSSIGVYHLCLGDNEIKDDSWRIALRVQHYSEGPSHGKKTAGDSALCTVPPVAVPLPSRSSYYLLDDFNHHHQHAVIEGNCERYASTHRVCRTEGHCYQYIVNKCRNVLSECISASSKHIRGVHLAFTELEMEWIRQFYVQGSLHLHLHPWWASRMSHLTDLWIELQVLYRKQMDILNLTAVTIPNISLIQDKKERKKVKKTIKKISVVTYESYDEMIVGLKDLVEKRKGWSKREQDLKNTISSDDLRPMVLPIQPEEVMEIEGFIRVIQKARTAFGILNKL